MPAGKRREGSKKPLSGVKGALRGDKDGWPAEEMSEKEEFKMAVPYNHHEVEQKWQQIWDDEKAFKTSDDYPSQK